MRIINAMFGRKKGGVEQAFLDYTRALTLRGHEVVAVTHPKAAILPQLGSITSHIHPISNFGQWDILAIYRLKKLLKTTSPDIIITHGNRAASLLRMASGGTIPVVAVCHNYQVKHTIKADALFTITEDLKRFVVEKGAVFERVQIIPNMVEIQEPFPAPSAHFHTPPVIGTMGRFVHKKGFHIFVDALRLLHIQGVSFRAVIGGNGEEEANLHALVKKYALDDLVQFTGWVSDKSAFYRNCDIFCLPSLHEPFGIVLLEAFMHAKPVVTTDSEGPLEIVTPNEDAVMVRKNDSAALAEGLQKLTRDKDFAQALAKSAVIKVRRYDNRIIGKTMEEALLRFKADFASRQQ